MPEGCATGDNRSVINLDEPIGKWVGRRGGGSPEDEYANLLRLGRRLTGGLTPFPRGVFRFESHEQADEWSRNHILRAAKKR